MPTSQTTPDAAPDERCVVCSKTIRLSEDHQTIHHGGKDYLACCPSCAQKFDAMPAVYTIS